MTTYRWTSAYGTPGELVVAAVYNPLENPSSRGKNRPVVLVRRDGARWQVMGLTTKARHRDGTPRRAEPHPYANGLNGPGYLWSRQLTGVSVLDIGQHIGWVDPALAATSSNTPTLGHTMPLRSSVPSNPEALQRRRRVATATDEHHEVDRRPVAPRQSLERGSMVP